MKTAALNLTNNYVSQFLHKGLDRSEVIENDFGDMYYSQEITVESNLCSFIDPTKMRYLMMKGGMDISNASPMVTSYATDEEKFKALKDQMRPYFNLVDKVNISKSEKEKGKDRLSRFMKNIDLVYEAGLKDFAIGIAERKVDALKEFEKYYQGSNNLTGFFKDSFEGNYNIGTVNGMKVIRDSQPSWNDLKYLIEKAGVKTIINLRSEENYWEGYNKKAEEELCKKSGIKYYNFRLEDYDNPPPSKDQIEEVLKVIDKSEGPVLFHCAKGKGRTGMVAAAYQMSRMGMPFDKAIEVAIHYGFSPDKNPNQLAVLKTFEKKRESATADQSQGIIAGLKNHVLGASNFIKSSINSFAFKTAI